MMAYDYPTFSRLMMNGIQQLNYAHHALISSAMRLSALIFVPAFLFAVLRDVRSRGARNRG